MKNSIFNLSALSFLALTVVACSDVGFKSVPSQTCANFNAQDQNCVPGSSTNTYNYSFQTGSVDILIVNDNSGSMYPEQQKMADRFPNFLNSISHLFYQIAMVTTDITSAESGPNAPHNGNGAFRDGKFLDFASNEFVLTPSTTGLVSKFQNTIKRQETLNCGSTGGFESTSCPSGDERGIYAMNLAAQRNEQGFFRPGAHLAVIILSDEDVRSNGGEFGIRLPETLDLPETFLQTMQDTYPTKTVSVHSVVIPPPPAAGAQSCLTSQSQSAGSPFPLRGFYGRMYAELSVPSTYNPNLLSFKNLTGGVLGSICATDYGAQLGDIGSFVSAEARQNEIQLVCQPGPNDVSVTASNGAQLSYTIDSNNRMIFTNLPIGITVNVSVVCPANI